MKKLPDILKCDVSDKETLALYRKCVKEWTEMLLGDDLHSIKNQLNEFVYRFALFKCYRKALELSYPKSEYPQGFSHQLLFVFQDTFLESHIMSIRRLADDNYSDPNKKVYSLVRLCDELIEHSSLITREHYVCFDGLGFDSEPDTGDNWRRNFDRTHRNTLFSTLCSNPTGARNDLIDVKKIKDLRKQIVGLTKIKRFASKFYAHAADPKTRVDENDYSFISMEEIERSHKVLFNVVHGLGKFIGEISLTELPTVLFDQFENWDKPILGSDQKVVLEKIWLEMTHSHDAEARAMRDYGFPNWERIKGV